MQDQDLLNEQLLYYRARASEYDEWFLRQGRYDRGPAHRAEWSGEAARVEAALRDVLPIGDVLELACGTGLWTRHLAAGHRRVVAVDASPEAIAINRARLKSSAVEYAAFWHLVRMALKPGGIVFFVDSLLEQTSTARDHHPLDESGIVQRRLNDGRAFRLVKVFYEPESLNDQLLKAGWQGWVRSSGRFFLYGLIEPRTEPEPEP